MIELSSLLYADKVGLVYDYKQDCYGTLIGIS